MKGVTFGNLHSYNDLQLILAEKRIGTPTVKKNLIDLPGGHGRIDQTEAFGEVKFDMRELSFDFSTIVPQSEFMTLFSRVQNALHGQKVQIVLDDDPEWYYKGRLDVSEWKADRRIGKLTIDCECDPFKRRLTAQAVNLCGRNLLNLSAGTATTEGAWTMTATGYTFKRGTDAGGSFVHFTVPVSRGQSYVFSADYTMTTRLLYVYKDKLYGTLVAKTQSGEPCIFTAEESGNYVFGLYVTSAATEGTFSNVMLEEGTQKGAYIAYDATTKTVQATFSNTNRPAIPSMLARGTVTVESPSNFATLTASKQTLPEFRFNRGDTTLTFKGNGYAVVEWEEGGL